MRQLDLPGQTHVAEGPHDHTGMYVMHHAFRRDLARFAAAATATPLGEPDTWAALAGRWDRFCHVLHEHHHAEDTHYWPVLDAAARARGTQADRAEVAAMSDEHAEIDPALTALTSAWSAMAGTPVTTTGTRSRSGSPACGRCSAPTSSTRRPSSSRSSSAS